MRKFMLLAGVAALGVVDAGARQGTWPTAAAAAAVTPRHGQAEHQAAAAPGHAARQRSAARDRRHAAMRGRAARHAERRLNRRISGASSGRSSRSAGSSARRGATTARMDRGRRATPGAPWPCRRPPRLARLDRAPPASRSPFRRRFDPFPRRSRPAPGDRAGRLSAGAGAAERLSACRRASCARRS